MSVNPSDDVSAPIVNAAFMSRTTDTSTTGVLALNNSGSAAIADVQDTLNKALSRESFATETISAGSFITISGDTVQFRRVEGDSGAVTTSNTPFGTTAATMVQGKVIEIVGTDDTNLVTIPRADVQYGCLLNGDATLGKGNILTIIYDDVLERWLELARNF